MPTPINLNADMAEGYGPYDIGDDAALLDIVQTANVACGMHGGDPSVMVRVIEQAKAKGVSIGAHPGFNDLWGFGRRRIAMNTRDLQHLVLYQIAAIDGMARTLGHPISHVKAHGALNNMACEDRAYADAIAGAVKAYNPDLIFVAVALSELAAAGEAHGLKVAHEAFADRAYEDDGMLSPRGREGAIIKDPDTARERVLTMLAEQAVISRSGKRLPTPIHTICHHGDEPSAVAVARAVRDALAAYGGFTLKPLPAMSFA